MVRCAHLFLGSHSRFGCYHRMVCMDGHEPHLRNPGNGRFFYDYACRNPHNLSGRTCLLHPHSSPNRRSDRSFWRQNVSRSKRSAGRDEPESSLCRPAGIIDAFAPSCASPAAEQTSGPPSLFLSRDHDNRCHDYFGFSYAASLLPLWHT